MYMTVDLSSDKAISSIHFPIPYIAWLGIGLIKPNRRPDVDIELPN